MGKEKTVVDQIPNDMDIQFATNEIHTLLSNTALGASSHDGVIVMDDTMYKKKTRALFDDFWKTYEDELYHNILKEYRVRFSIVKEKTKENKLEFMLYLMAQNALWIKSDIRFCEEKLGYLMDEFQSCYFHDNVDRTIRRESVWCMFANEFYNNSRRISIAKRLLKKIK